MNINERYIRNLMLDGFDESVQQRLGASRVGIVGAGALGSVVAMYLAAAGTGFLRIADADVVGLSNLQRQVFFSEGDIGVDKCDVLSRRIHSLNSGVEVECFEEFVNSGNEQRFFEGCDVVAECSDSSESKSFIVTKGCEAGKPVIVGGVNGYQGQLGVFSPMTEISYADVFPEPEEKEKAPGVFSPVPGIVASLQAAEILKLLGGITKTGENYLLDFDVRTMCFRRFGL